MVGDAQLHRADRMMSLLGQVEKTYKIDKHKAARELLLRQSLEGGLESMKAVQMFRDDPLVLQTYKSEATNLLHGHVVRASYNMCLGLLAARLVLW